jgi:RIO kinase 1
LRANPDWLITDDYTDAALGVLKSGKEAEIFVVERTSLDDTRRCLLAHKRYRPKSVKNKGELEALGFTRASSFVNDHLYREGRRFRRSREQRAVERMTDYGKKVLSDKWMGLENDVMTRVWQAGGPVPFPVGFSGDGMLLEYIGDESQAAPTLGHARLTKSELAAAADQLVDGLRVLMEVGIVHADLSAFNLLWWEGRLQFIDFPQAVDLALNPHGLEFLHRDVANVTGWFARHGVSIDADKLYAELLALAFPPSA